MAASERRWLLLIALVLTLVVVVLAGFFVASASEIRASAIFRRRGGVGALAFLYGLALIVYFGETEAKRRRAVVTWLAILMPIAIAYGTTTDKPFQSARLVILASCAAAGALLGLGLMLGSKFATSFRRPP